MFKLGGSIEDIISFFNRCYPLPVFLCSDGYIHGLSLIDFSELIKYLKCDFNVPFSPASSRITLSLPIKPISDSIIILLYSKI